MNPSREKSKLSWNQTCNIHNTEILKDVKDFKLWKWLASIISSYESGIIAYSHITVMTTKRMSQVLIIKQILHSITTRKKRPVHQ